jgi:DNA-binding response OmpR family regulator
MRPNKFRILFVEDHEDTRDLLVLALQQSSRDYDVVATGTVAGGLALAQTEKFDLFVLDSRLTDGSGIELCKQIRQMGQSTPILFYSAMAYEKDKQEAFNSGAQRYLVKPVSIPLLCETVAELINGPLEAARLLDPGYATHQIPGQGTALTCRASEISGLPAPVYLEPSL